MLLVNSIFTSISGEVGAIPQGTPVTFIRLQGCNLRCPYCDTAHSWDHESGYQMSIDEVISYVKTKNVVLTGGEPLIQLQWSPLAVKLMSLNHKVQVETNGTRPVDETLRICYVVDQKMFLSPEQRQPGKNTIQLSGAGSWLKYVVSNQTELTETVCELLDDIRFLRCKLAISVVNDENGAPMIPYGHVINELISNGLDNVVVNFQIHKLVDLP